jgi:hypothetical protein
MASNSLPDLSPEHANAHKIAARALAKYWQEFARWRTADRVSAGSLRPLRPQGMLVTPLTKKPDPSVTHRAV